MLAPGGRLVELGKLRVWSSEEVRRFRWDVSYATLLLDARTVRAAPTLGAELRQIAEAVHLEELKLPPVKVFALSAAVEALGKPTSLKS